jgi:DNA binding domain, excisionase family
MVYLLRSGKNRPFFSPRYYFSVFLEDAMKAKRPEGWITTSEAAEMTGYAQAYFRILAKQGKVAAIKVGRDWLLDRESVLAHKAKMESLGKLKHNPWRKDLQTGGQGGEQDAE